MRKILPVPKKVVKGVSLLKHDTGEEDERWNGHLREKESREGFSIFKKKTCICKMCMKREILKTQE